MGPLSGIRVVVVEAGTTAVGCGLATALPGIVLRDLGAEVTHVRSSSGSTLDAGLVVRRAWDAGQEVVESSDAELATTVRSLAADADVLITVGDISDLAVVNPALVHVRIAPSVDARGTVPDVDLLVAARAGVLTQIRGHRSGPVFPDLNVASAGAGLVATVGALAGLVERAATGRGGWFETSLLDGVYALLPMIMGRVENHSGATRLLWERQGPSESLAYRCGDGGYVQLWFGAKGAFEAFLERMGEPPSETGYQAELISGAMGERDLRWQAKFAEQDRAWWLSELAGADFRCEPVWQPGEALRDEHVRSVGLAVAHDGITRLGPIVRVAPAGVGLAPSRSTGRLLEGVRVLDLSAYLAGPVAARVLAELGADVVKVEPLTGDVHRSMEPMFAAGQQRKRAVALDLKSPEPADALTRLFRWADVVHHNSRVGLADRLGYDEATVRAANPSAVYCHASGFGQTGPRALLAANDQLMQALAGIEASQGGAGNPPTYLVWGAVDVASGWLSACGILAALFARRVSGEGQSVDTSLLGAAMALKSGAFYDGDELVRGPVLDAAQTGYGAAYRIYECRDGAWLALAVTDQGSWDALRSATGADLPAAPPPLHTDGEPDAAEPVLEAAFRTRPRDEWVAALREAGVPVEPVPDADRAGFIALAVDDAVNRELGRVSSFAWGDRGRIDVMVGALRVGPDPLPSLREGIPGLGEHTAEVLAEANG